MKNLILMIITVLAMTQAQDEKSNGSKIELIGYASYQGGQVLSGSYRYPNDIHKFWYQKVFANLGLKKRINNWLSITAAIEANMRLSYRQGSTFPESEYYTHNFYIDEARGDFSFIDNKWIKLQLTLGYFHFSYNKDTHNLGDILFRSYCYPPTIIPNELDFPFTRLCGLDFNTSFLNGLFFNDFLATIHVDFYPANDLSLTDIFGFYWRGIKIGTGVQFDRIVPMSEEITTPKYIYKIDPNKISDTVKYTYAGTKFLSFVNIDIKKIIFGEDYPPIFGKNDAKLFFEMDILGMKNYYHYYENRKERIAIIFGVLLPTFNILDVLSLEFEHFGSRYPNSIERPLNSNSPLPDIQLTDYTPDNYKNDDWKWSWYAKRSFSNFSIIFQVAHDHLWLWSTRSADQVYRDNLVDIKKDFYYQLKFKFNL